MSILKTSQRCFSHCRCTPPTSSTRPRKFRAPHCRSDRQNPPILNSMRHHCQKKNNEAITTCSPSQTNRIPSKINTCLRPETTLNTFLQHVSHCTAVNTVSSMKTSLVVDTAEDGHTSFHTTLQGITSQGSKPLHVKVDPGASFSSIPLSHFCKAFPKHFTKSGALKNTALKPVWMTWSAHDGTCQTF